ncbi:MAG TPA: 5-deoxy-glucuronate isomerase [bacterium]|nr:5-deoxy-glucuronate isomerase [bacterium]
MDYLIKYNGQKGHVPVVKPGDGGLKMISFDMLFFEKGDEYSEDTGSLEVCLVILGGKCTFEAGGKRWENVGEREDVFGGSAASLFVPANNSFKVEATDENPVEIAILRVPSKSDGGAPVFISPDMVKIVERGKDNWTRYVHDIVDKDIPATAMLVGETFSPAGNWSSAPPHRHDNDNPPEETDHEEIYLFKCKPAETGFQVIRLYTDDLSLNETYTVESNDTVIITQGYHPVAAGPGYKGYYLWILAGKERVIHPYDDPKHVWLKNT